MALQLDLDVDARRKIEPHQLVDRLRRRAVDVDQPLVGPHLEVLPRVLVLERTTDHAVHVLLRRQGHGTSDRRPASLSGVDDRLGRPVELLVVVPLETDADLLLRQAADLPYFSIAVTTPAPTVRPPSRTANRRPWSIAIG